MAAPGGIDLLPLTRPDLLTLSAPIRETLARTPYNPPDPNHVSIKCILESLLPRLSPEDADLLREATDFCLCCAALAAAEGEDSPSMYWIPRDLSVAAWAALEGVARAVGVREVRELVEGLMPVVFPLIKGVIKESCVDPEELDVAGSAGKKPVAYAVVAVRQFRWFVCQVHYPHLGKLCSLVMPCALTALDHWSPEVKAQGMLTFIHLAKNVTSAELSWYEDPILDVCCRNIASNDELWQHVMEMSVLLLTCILQGNPRSPWYEKILTEMISHLERQPMNKDRRITWLLLIEPVLTALGLVLLAHFRRIFSLLFQWLHADDDETLVLVLQRIQTIIKLTWIRKSPNFIKLVDELTLVYKEAAVRKSREVIRTLILNILILLKQCKGLQFETVWDKHKNDPNLSALVSSLDEI